MNGYRSYFVNSSAEIANGRTSDCSSKRPKFDPGTRSFFCQNLSNFVRCEQTGKNTNSVISHLTAQLEPQNRRNSFSKLANKLLEFLIRIQSSTNHQYRKKLSKKVKIRKSSKQKHRSLLKKLVIVRLSQNISFLGFSRNLQGSFLKNLSFSRKQRL